MGGKEYVLDTRAYEAPQKFQFEFGGYSDRLHPGDVLKIISPGDLRWVEKHCRMYRPGKFKVTLQRDEAENVNIAILERL